MGLSTDREKVIKESEEAIDILSKIDEPTFYADFVRCAFEKALSLLKEQEAVEPTVEQDGHGSWWYQCGKCKMPIDYRDRFCRHCGQAMRWPG